MSIFFLYLFIATIPITAIIPITANMAKLSPVCGIVPWATVLSCPFVVPTVVPLPTILTSGISGSRSSFWVNFICGLYYKVTVYAFSSTSL